LEFQLQDTVLRLVLVSEQELVQVSEQVLADMELGLRYTKFLL
jgi:hypothetical protein